MSVAVTCAKCSNRYELKDEFAGKLVKCPKCGTSNRVEGAKIETAPQADPEFDRDVFLLRQKALSVSEKYFVSGEKGEPLMYVERPAHFVRNFLATIAGMTAGVIVLTLGFSAVDALDRSGMRNVALLVGIATALGFLAALLIVGVGLSKKRHTTFYRGAQRGTKLMDVLQLKKLEFLTTTFTIRDAQERPLGMLRKNQLTNIIRKKWRLMDLSGRDILVAKEDSIILSLLRRLLGPLFGLLRTNYVFEDANGRHVGEFQRKLTILDRYALDMRADPRRTVDRRLALALGVILDTGERR